jgi:predicted acylesterase/phospholipase RssA
MWLMQQFDAYLGDTGTRWLDKYDLICGTSAGAVAAIATSMHDFDTKASMYSQMHSLVVTWLSRVCKGAFSFLKLARYGFAVDDAIRRQHMVDMLSRGDETLPFLHRPGKPRAGVFVCRVHPKTRVVIPHLITNYPTTADTGARAATYEEEVFDDLCYETSHGWTITDAGLAATAVPILTHPFMRNTATPERTGAEAEEKEAIVAADAEEFLDGAMLANCPVEYAVAEAARQWPGRHVGCVHSIGYGRFTNKAPTVGSIYAWVKYLLSKNCVNEPASLQQASMFVERLSMRYNATHGTRRRTSVIRLEPDAFDRGLGFTSTTPEAQQEHHAHVTAYATSPACQTLFRRMVDDLGLHRMPPVAETGPGGAGTGDTEAQSLQDGPLSFSP